MVLMFFSGCGMLNVKDVEKEPLDISGFNTVVKTQINNIEICGNAYYVVSDALYFDFVAPKTINGTKIVCRNGEYEVDFNVGKTEYDYEIDAVTGVILDKDVDNDAFD